MESTSKRAYWNRRVEDWKTSGLDQKAFCSREGLVYPTFCYWVHKLAQSAANLPFVSNGGHADCIAIELTEPWSPASGQSIPLQANGLELQLDQAVIRIYGTIDTRTLVKLAALCESLCPEPDHVQA